MAWQVFLTSDTNSSQHLLVTCWLVFLLNLWIGNLMTGRKTGTCYNRSDLWKEEVVGKNIMPVNSTRKQIHIHNFAWWWYDRVMDGVRQLGFSHLLGVTLWRWHEAKPWGLTQPHKLYKGDCSGKKVWGGQPRPYLTMLWPSIYGFLFHILMGLPVLGLLAEVLSAPTFRHCRYAFSPQWWHGWFLSDQYFLGGLVIPNRHLEIEGISVRHALCTEEERMFECLLLAWKINKNKNSISKQCRFNI